MSLQLKNILRFALFILIQVFVLDKIRLHQMVTPYLYFLFILWLPFNMNLSLQLLIAFLFGFALDSFRHNPGFHAAACVLIAFVRPVLISRLIPQEGADGNYEEPSPKSMGGNLPYFTYVAMLTVIHNVWLFLLEAWQFGNIWYFIFKTLLSSAISLLLIIVTEMLVTRKQKFKTNTA